MTRRADDFSVRNRQDIIQNVKTLLGHHPLDAAASHNHCLLQ
jgi:hypothetical protein